MSADPPRGLGQLIRDALAAMKAEGLPFEQLEPDAGFKRHHKEDAYWYICDAGTGRTGRPWLQVSAGDARIAGGVDEATFSWCSWTQDQGGVDQGEQEEIRKQLEQAAQRRRERQAQDREAAAEQSAATWAAASTDTNGHPYLAAKGVGAWGIRRLNHSLLVPVADTSGKVHGVQTIGRTGEKRFNTGCAVGGHFHMIGTPGRLLYLAEGYATGATIHEATGAAVAVCFNCGNLKPVAQALRESYPDVELVICADNDQWTQGNPGLTKAREAAATVGTGILFPSFQDITSHPTDFNDLARLEGVDEVRRQLLIEDHPHVDEDPGPQAEDPPLDDMPDEDQDQETEETPEETPEEAVRRLAVLSPLAYETVREEEAKALGVRVSVLDREVERARGGQADKGGEGSLVEELEPWPEEVSGLDLLNDIRADFERHVVADPEALDGASLWDLGTFVYDQFSLWPKLFLSSPERRCGKTTMLEISEANCSRGLVASSITASAIFRVVDKSKPTLIIDEADRLPKDNEELNGIINCGHTRRGAFVIRTTKVGDDFEPRRFSVWAPMILAAIGTMADTIMDRSIVIPMRRKAPGESAHKVPMDLFEQRQTARRMALRWAADNADALRNAQATVPAHGNDRARDNWHPLFRIAKVVGGDWPARALKAFHKLTVEEEGDEAGPMLLADIREVFEAKSNADKLASQTIVDALIAMEGRPWAEWRKGKPITQNSLARLLKPYKIKPDDIYIHKVLKGYTIGQFKDTWTRYLRKGQPDIPSPSDPAFQTAEALNPLRDKGSGDSQTAEQNHHSADGNPRDPLRDKGFSGLADEKGAHKETHTHEPTRGPNGMYRETF